MILNLTNAGPTSCLEYCTTSAKILAGAVAEFSSLPPSVSTMVDFEMRRQRLFSNSVVLVRENLLLVGNFRPKILHLAALMFHFSLTTSLKQSRRNANYRTCMPPTNNQKIFLLLLTLTLSKTLPTSRPFVEKDPNRRNDK